MLNYRKHFEIIYRTQGSGGEMSSTICDIKWHLWIVMFMATVADTRIDVFISNLEERVQDKKCQVFATKKYKFRVTSSYPNEAFSDWCSKLTTHKTD